MIKNLLLDKDEVATPCIPLQSESLTSQTMSLKPPPTETMHEPISTEISPRSRKDETPEQVSTEISPRSRKDEREVSKQNSDPGPGIPSDDFTISTNSIETSNEVLHEEGSNQCHIIDKDDATVPKTIIHSKESSEHFERIASNNVSKSVILCEDDSMNGTDTGNEESLSHTPPKSNNPSTSQVPAEEQKISQMIQESEIPRAQDTFTEDGEIFMNGDGIKIQSHHDVDDISTTSSSSDDSSSSSSTSSSSSLSSSSPSSSSSSTSSSSTLSSSSGQSNGESISRMSK